MEGTDGGGTLITVLSISMYLVTAGSIAVLIFSTCGLGCFKVSTRTKIPKLRRKVNTNYLENRADNRYGLIPFAGPIMSGLCAFLNQPPLVREGKLLNWDAYVANLATYGSFVGAIVCYEKGLSAWAIVLLIITILFAAYDIVQDVREVLNFSFGVCLLDTFKRVRRAWR